MTNKTTMSNALHAQGLVAHVMHAYTCGLVKVSHISTSTGSVSTYVSIFCDTEQEAKEVEKLVRCWMRDGDSLSISHYKHNDCWTTEWEAGNSDWDILK